MKLFPTTRVDKYLLEGIGQCRRRDSEGRIGTGGDAGFPWTGGKQ